MFVQSRSMHRQHTSSIEGVEGNFEMSNVISVQNRNFAFVGPLLFGKTEIRIWHGLAKNKIKHPSIRTKILAHSQSLILKWILFTKYLSKISFTYRRALLINCSLEMVQSSQIQLLLLNSKIHIIRIYRAARSMIETTKKKYHRNHFSDKDFVSQSLFGVFDLSYSWILSVDSENSSRLDNFIASNPGPHLCNVVYHFRRCCNPA